MREAGSQHRLHFYETDLQTAVEFLLSANKPAFNVLGFDFLQPSATVLKTAELGQH